MRCDKIHVRVLRTMCIYSMKSLPEFLCSALFIGSHEIRVAVVFERKVVSASQLLVRTYNFADVATITTSRIRSPFSCFLCFFLASVKKKKMRKRDENVRAVCGAFCRSYRLFSKKQTYAVCRFVRARLALSYSSRCVRHLIHSNDKPTTKTSNFLKFNYYLNSTVTLLVRITTLFIRILVFKRRSYDIYI